jgi:hypothetical protein
VQEKLIPRTGSRHDRDASGRYECGMGGYPDDQRHLKPRYLKPRYLKEKRQWLN